MVLDPEADLKDWPHLQAGSATPGPDPAAEDDLEDEFADLPDADGDGGDSVEDDLDYTDIDDSADEETVIAA